MTGDDEARDNYMHFLATLIEGCDDGELALIYGFCSSEVAIRSMRSDKNAGQA